MALVAELCQFVCIITYFCLLMMLSRMCFGLHQAFALVLHDLCLTPLFSSCKSSHTVECYGRWWTVMPNSSGVRYGIGVHDRGKTPKWFRIIWLLLVFNLPVVSIHVMCAVALNNAFAWYWCLCTFSGLKLSFYGGGFTTTKFVNQYLSVFTIHYHVTSGGAIRKQVLMQ